MIGLCALAVVSALCITTAVTLSTTAGDDRYRPWDSDATVLTNVRAGKDTGGRMKLVEEDGYFNNWVNLAICAAAIIAILVVNATATV
jgi:hypothetical protein